MAIPVIDFQLIRRHLQGGGEGAGPLEMLHQAFSTVGFVYLSNHGIDEELVGNYLATSTLACVMILMC